MKARILLVFLPCLSFYVFSENKPCGENAALCECEEWQWTYRYSSRPSGTNTIETRNYIDTRRCTDRASCVAEHNDFIRSQHESIDLYSKSIADNLEIPCYDFCETRDSNVAWQRAEIIARETTLSAVVGPHCISGKASSATSSLGRSSTDLSLITTDLKDRCLSSASIGPHCEFYSCLESKLSCGTDGYALGYGKNYCQLFAADKRFSPEGRKWRDSTLICLQESLAGELFKEANSCQAIKSIAFTAHPDCYTDNGSISVCDLPWKDKSVVWDIITLDSFLGLKQFISTGLECLKNQKGSRYRTGKKYNPESQD